MPSQKAFAFLTKSAKGIKGGFDIDALKEALPLIGWEIDEVIVPLPIDGEKAAGQMNAIFQKNGIAKAHSRFGGMGLHDEHLMYLAPEEEDKAKSLFTDIKAFATETTSAKGPSSVKLGELVLRDLKIYRQAPFQSSDLTPQRWILSFREAWLGVTGWTVKTPKGTTTFTPKMSYSGRMESLAEKGSDRFWTFAYKAGLKDLATTFLALMGADVVQNTLKPVDPRTLANTGTCPACFGNTKMVKGRMIRHGWSVSGQRQRGVWGLTWHTGPCFGVGYPPFELSPEGTKDYLRLVLHPALKSTEERVGYLKSRPESLTVEINRKPETISQDHRDYEPHLKRQVLEAASHLKDLESDLDNLRYLLSTWEVKPLPGTPPPV